MNLKDIIREESTVIVDVRTPAEYSGGHVSNSINIPLQEIQKRVDELGEMKDKQIVLCCASGNRSGMAVQYLKNQGFQYVYNGGGWLDVNYLKNN